MEQVSFLMEITEIVNFFGQREKVFGPVILGSVSEGDKVRVVHIIEKVNLRGYEFNMIIEHMESFSEKNYVPKKGDFIGLILSGKKEYKIRKGMYILAGEGESELDKLLTNNMIL